MKSFVLFFAFFFVLPAGSASAQKYLVLDKYGIKRIKIKEGEGLMFRHKESGKIYRDRILQLGDSTLRLEKLDYEIKLSEIDRVYFERGATRALSSGFAVLGTGFLLSSGIGKLTDAQGYSPEEHLWLGLGFMALSRAVLLFRFRKFRINKNGRIRILDLTFGKNPQPTK